MERVALTTVQADGKRRNLNDLGDISQAAGPLFAAYAATASGQDHLHPNRGRAGTLGTADGSATQEEVGGTCHPQTVRLASVQIVRHSAQGCRYRRSSFLGSPETAPACFLRCAYRERHISMFSSRLRVRRALVTTRFRRKRCVVWTEEDALCALCFCITGTHGPRAAITPPHCNPPCRRRQAAQACFCPTVGNHRRRGRFPRRQSIAGFSAIASTPSAPHRRHLA